MIKKMTIPDAARTCKHVFLTSRTASIPLFKASSGAKLFNIYSLFQLIAPSRSDARLMLILSVTMKTNLDTTRDMFSVSMHKMNHKRNKFKQEKVGKQYFFG
ncbi:hypothetical protein EDC96DRAFT_565591 [Choanephora cucurbitarum]|nr:hypothetical protein EDC96DRAFT_565591 [Choanephora cucurbitarum]